MTFKIKANFGHERKGLVCALVLEGKCVSLPLTCEADGTLEGTSHAFEAVLYQVAKQLGR